MKLPWLVTSADHSIRAPALLFTSSIYDLFPAHVITGVKNKEWACATSMCVLFMSSTSGTIFNPSTGTITDHSITMKACILNLSKLWRALAEASSHFYSAE